MSSSSLTIAEESASLSELKAAYLYNFTQFIEWPEEAFQSKHTPFTLCLVGVGVNDIYGQLKGVSDYQYHDRRINVVQLDSPEQASNCQLVFFNADTEQFQRRLNKTLPQVPVLTVGVQPGFVQSGGMIGFILVGKHLRFEVNRPALMQAGLIPRATLLEVADRVIGIPKTVPAP